MSDFNSPFNAVYQFLLTGGFVLWIIFMMALLLWTLIIERYWYIWRVFPIDLHNEIKAWNQRQDKSSWNALHIRHAKLSQLKLKLNQHLSFIRTLVMLCPMLGLLGTVTGMISVFDVMAVVGTGNARAMASGVSMATIPTMAGLVTALSGFYFSARLKHHVSNAQNKFENFTSHNNEVTNAA